MANYAYSPKGFDPSSLETTFANQMSGPAANQLIGYLYASRLDREQGNRDYQDTMLRSQAMANASAREKMQYDLAAALAGKETSLGMTTPGRSILAPGAEELAAAYSFAGLDKERAQAFRNFGAGADDFARAGAAPPMGSTYSLSGQPQEKLVQGEPLSIRLKRMGDGNGASNSIAEAKLTLAEQKMLADNMRQYDKMTMQAETQTRKDLAATNKIIGSAARAKAIEEINQRHATVMSSIEQGKQNTLASIGRKVATPQAATSTSPVATATQAAQTPTATDVDRELAKARNALAKNAPRAEIEKVLRSRGVDPALLNVR